MKDPSQRIGVCMNCGRSLLNPHSCGSSPHRIYPDYDELVGPVEQIEAPIGHVIVDRGWVRDVDSLLARMCCDPSRAVECYGSEIDLVGLSAKARVYARRGY